MRSKKPTIFYMGHARTEPSFVQSTLQPKAASVQQLLLSF